MVQRNKAFVAVCLTVALILWGPLVLFVGDALIYLAWEQGVVTLSFVLLAINFVIGAGATCIRMTKARRHVYRGLFAGIGFPVVTTILLLLLFWCMQPYAAGRSKALVVEAAYICEMWVIWLMANASLYVTEKYGDKAEAWFVMRACRKNPSSQ